MSTSPSRQGFGPVKVVGACRFKTCLWYDQKRATAAFSFIVCLEVAELTSEVIRVVCRYGDLSARRCAVGRVEIRGRWKTLPRSED